MERLPSEILLMIFRYIDDYRQRTRLELVCQQWRKILLKDGWKHVQRIEGQLNTHQIGMIGQRCGAHLVECSFYKVDIDSTSIHLIAEHFPKLKHLDFRYCHLELSENVLQPFRELGTRLRSLTFFMTDFHPQLDHHLLRHFPRLRHLGLQLSSQNDVLSLPNRFSAELRSLYLSSFTEFRLDIGELLTNVLSDSPRLAALCLDIGDSSRFLRRISALKNLCFLRIALDSFESSELLCSCLNNLPKLLVLQLKLPFQFYPLWNMFQSPPFRGLVHLSLSLILHPSAADNYAVLTLLSMNAPKLRSLSLDISPAHLLNDLELTNELSFEVFKIAYNGVLEFLNVPCASFWADERLKQIVQRCPNLISLGVQLKQDVRLYLTDLRRIVENQWRKGMRKHLPLRMWIYGGPDFSRQDTFLAIQSVPFGFAPPNPVLNALFRNEMFNENESGGTPSFVTEHYTSMA